MLRRDASYLFRLAACASPGFVRAQAQPEDESIRRVAWHSLKFRVPVTMAEGLRWCLIGAAHRVSWNRRIIRRQRDDGRLRTLGLSNAGIAEATSRS